MQHIVFEIALLFCEHPAHCKYHSNLDDIIAHIFWPWYHCALRLCLILILVFFRIACWYENTTVIVLITNERIKLYWVILEYILSRQAFCQVAKSTNLLSLKASETASILRWLKSLQRITFEFFTWGLISIR